MIRRLKKIYEEEGFRGITVRLGKRFQDWGGIRGTAVEMLNCIGESITKQRIWYRHFDRMLGKKVKGEGYRREYERFVRADAVGTTDSGRTPVYVCWFQGMGNAPDIVKACYRNLKERLDESRFELITLDKDNYIEYADFPDFLMGRIERHEIPWTHVSDILRTYLVAVRGGLWLDATMFLTQNPPEEILRQQLFVFKLNYYQKNKSQVASSQFIYAKEPGNEILERTLLGLYLYWEKHRKLEHYFMYHYIFAIAVDSNARTREEFRKMPFRSGANNHMLHDELTCRYDPERYEFLTSLSFVHKTTYKIEKRKICPESNYIHLLKEHDITLE